VIHGVQEARDSSPLSSTALQMVKFEYQTGDQVPCEGRLRGTPALALVAQPAQTWTVALPRL
jgi:hypothetical protein